MARVLVTGATGNLGRLTIEALLRRRENGAAIEFAALARNPETVRDLIEQGVDVRPGDYRDDVAMRSALQGVDRLLLVSAPTFTDRSAAHLNVIEAASRAGVERVLYTSVQGQQAGRFTFSEVTTHDAVTIDALTRSSMRTTIAYNSLFLDSLLELIGDEPRSHATVTVPASDGAVAAIARADLAEAYARILTDPDPAATYTLTGPRAVTMAELAASIGTALGHAVTYEPVSVGEFVASRTAVGVPEAAARFMAEWFEAIAAGEFPAEPDFAELVGRPATSISGFLASTLYATRP